MKFNILEDDFMQQARIERCLRKAIERARITNAEIYIESNPKKYLRSIELTGTNQIYLLDIEIKNFSMRTGLEVAKEIRKKDPYGSIIFITTHENFAPITYKYKVSALGFISKELTDLEIISELRQYLNHIHNSSYQITDEELLTLGVGRDVIQLHPSNLLFIETVEPRKLQVITKNSQTIIFEKLKNIEKLHNDFILSHRSVLVNYKNIYRVDSKERLIYFENGDSCIIAKRKIGEFQRMLKRKH